MHDKMYPLPTKEFSQRRRELTPEVDKAIWVASEMSAGAAFAHSNIALETMADAAHR